MPSTSARIVPANQPLSRATAPRSALPTSRLLTPGAAGCAAGAAAANYASAPVSLDQAGYMPLRREFEVEYHNDAEEAISPLVFEDDDTKDEREAKFLMLELYNRKLQERYQRREFVITRGLMNVKRLVEREQNDSTPYQSCPSDDADRLGGGVATEARKARKMGHLTVTAPTAEQARDVALKAAAVLGIEPF